MDPRRSTWRRAALLLLAAYLQRRRSATTTSCTSWPTGTASGTASWPTTAIPSTRSDAQTTLGFFPLYPIAIWLVEPVFTLVTGHDAIWSATVAGVSSRGSAAASPRARLPPGRRLVGPASARRATILFIVFPGSVVFSMVYSEGLLLPLAAGCLFALERRRWLLAGVLAGFGTAVQPTALVLVPVCAVSARARAAPPRLEPGATPARRVRGAAAVGHRRRRASRCSCGSGPAPRWPTTRPSTTAGARRPTRWRSCT